MIIKRNSFVAATLSTIALTAVASLGVSSQALAQSLTFQGNSSATFGTPNTVTNGNPQFSGVGSNTFTFGDASSSTFGTGPNELTFAGNSFSTVINSPFQVGNFTYFNGETALGTTVDSVPLNIQLAFTSPSGLSQQSLGFDIQVVATPNDTGDPVLDADSIFPVKRFANSNFNVGGTDYTLELIGFSQDGGATVVNEFRLPENEFTTTAAFGRITAAPPATAVPEPSSTVGLLALSVLGTGAMLKRKLKNQKSVKLNNSIT